MNAEYEAQMAATNDGTSLPYIDWRKMAQAAVAALQLTSEARYEPLGAGIPTAHRWVTRWERLE